MNKRAGVVTGGASGMGAAVVEQLLRDGACVVAVDRDSAALAKLKDRFASDQLLTLQADISDEKAAAAMISRCATTFGGVAFLVNCAGISGAPETIENTNIADFDTTVAVNLRGTYLSMRAAIGEMKRAGAGSIVNISSTAGIRPLPSATAYTASKFAVVGITLSAALESAKHGIRVNAVCPGVTDTPMLHRSASREYGENIGNATPMGRIGKAEEIANAVVWLLSDKASFVTGLIMPVDGGLSLI